MLQSDVNRTFVYPKLKQAQRLIVPGPEFILSSVMNFPVTNRTIFSVDGLRLSMRPSPALISSLYMSTRSTATGVDDHS